MLMETGVNKIFSNERRLRDSLIGDTLISLGTYLLNDKVDTNLQK